MVRELMQRHLPTPSKSEYNVGKNGAIWVLAVGIVIGISEGKLRTITTFPNQMAVVIKISSWMLEVGTACVNTVGEPSVH